jgi:hypothetical protein
MEESADHARGIEIRSADKQAGHAYEKCECKKTAQAQDWHGGSVPLLS